MNEGKEGSNLQQVKSHIIITLLFITAVRLGMFLLIIIIFCSYSFVCFILFANFLFLNILAPSIIEALQKK